METRVHVAVLVMGYVKVKIGKAQMHFSISAMLHSEGVLGHSGALG